MNKETRERLTATALLHGSLMRSKDGLTDALNTALSLKGNKHYSSLTYASLALVESMEDDIVAELQRDIPCKVCNATGWVRRGSRDECPTDAKCGQCYGFGYDASLLD